MCGRQASMQAWILARCFVRNFKKIVRGIGRMADAKKLPIGVEYFKSFKYDNFYYVDKTGFISSLLNTRGAVNLFTRPRRFGKSLNMDMLKTFFEICTDTSLFEGLEIRKDTKICEQYMGKYPVISISLKDISGASYADA